MGIKREFTTEVALPTLLTEALNRVGGDVVFIPSMGAWDTPIYPDSTIFFLKHFRLEEVESGFLHEEDVRQFQAYRSADLGPIAEIVLAVLNADALPKILDVLWSILQQKRIRSLRLEIIAAQSPDGQTYSSFKAEGDASSVNEALREYGKQIRNDDHLQ